MRIIIILIPYMIPAMNTFVKGSSMVLVHYQCDGQRLGSDGRTGVAVADRQRAGVGAWRQRASVALHIDRLIIIGCYGAAGDRGG